MTDPGPHLARMRARVPLVQNITNFVAMDTVANILLAVGATPAMVHAQEEVEEFARLADALAINIGTAQPSWADGMEAAAQAMRALNRPWVLDPVAVGATTFRRCLGARLLALRPAVIRGNASEIRALSGQDAVGRGTDSADLVEAAAPAARALALRTGAVVAVTGPADFVTDGTRAARIANGHPMMPRVTALGCALTGVVAAFAAHAPPFPATVAALACYGIAGEMAGGAGGPASFRTAFIDALHGLTPEMASARARVVSA